MKTLSTLGIWNKVEEKDEVRYSDLPAKLSTLFGNSLIHRQKLTSGILMLNSYKKGMSLQD